MDLGLQNKIALISGGSQGIGAAAARILASEGAQVAVCARSPEGLSQLKQEILNQIGADVLTIQADFSVAQEIDQAVEQASAHFGGIDILINSAGSSMFGQFDSIPDDRWMQDMNLKLYGAVRACRAVLPIMKKRGGGRIINIAGNSGKQPYMWHYPGGAANAAMVNFTHALSQEVCRDNILVTAVCPGPVETLRLRKQLQALADIWHMPLKEAEEKFYSEQPLGRAATSEEVANLIAFLASDKATYITGTAINVDGGITKCI